LQNGIFGFRISVAVAGQASVDNFPAKQQTSLSRQGETLEL
jgi:hypothetical protein